MRRTLVALVLLVAGCARTVQVATPPPARDETIVLLPGPDGKVGALTVIHEGQQRTLDGPYATARVPAQGTLEDGGRLTAEQVQHLFGAALGAQPPRPVRFVLYFLDNSDEFTPTSKLELTKILAAIAGRPALEIVVVGHTDRVGAVPYNDVLSLRRAERVRADLVQMGIRPEQVSAAGRGEREPLVATEDEIAEPRNRRVEITVR
jgi:outer membrane protein OmpA-like peptidoglycan-associated protein